MSDYRIEELAAGVFARLGRGPVQPNCGFVIGDEGVIVFDSSYSPAAGQAIREDISRVTTKPVATLVLSHHHWDHAWGAQAFPAARVVAHARARTALATRADASLASLRANPARPASWMEISADQLVQELDGLQVTLPTLTYTDSATFWSGGREVQLRHFGAAHTYGDTLLWLPQESMLFGGDVVCNKLIPVIGDGDPLHFVEALDAIAELGAETIVPGHGALGGPAELRAFQSCLRALIDEVEAARRHGAADAEAALASVALKEFGAWAGRDILPGSVRRIWQLLSEQRA